MLQSLPRADGPYLKFVVVCEVWMDILLRVLLEEYMLSQPPDLFWVGSLLLCWKAPSQYLVQILVESW